MRKSAICIAIGLQTLVVCGVAHAQSSVTLYGVADVFLEQGTAGTAAASVSTTRLQSGGANGSRVGLRGTQDIGDGLKANYVFESGLVLDTGNQASSTTFWNRQSYVGLSGDWGALTMGRQYSPLLVHQDTFDTALSTTGYGSPYNSGVMRTLSRVNNSVLYNSPKLGGFSTAVMYGLGETTGDSGNSVSASAKYAVGSFAAGLGYAHINKADATKEDKNIVNLAGSYKFGNLLLSAAIQRTQNDSQAANVVDDRQEAFLGATYAIGSGEIRVAYGQGEVTNVSNSTAKHTSLAYVHKLYKDTAVYVAVQAVENPSNLAYRTTGFTFDAIDGGLAAGAGVTAQAFAIGLRHRF
ncbi:MAG: porin [Pseudomonadota bacterium]